LLKVDVVDLDVAQKPAKEHRRHAIAALKELLVEYRSWTQIISHDRFVTEPNIPLAGFHSTSRGAPTRSLLTSTVLLDEDKCQRESVIGIDDRCGDVIVVIVEEVGPAAIHCCDS